LHPGTHKGLPTWSTLKSSLWRPSRQANEKTHQSRSASSKNVARRPDVPSKPLLICKSRWFSDGVADYV
jgi:hypothetical protein